MQLTDIAVLGAGSMGHGIAELAAMAGYDVTVRDVDAAVLEEGYDRVEWSLNKFAEKDRLDEDPGTVLDRLSTTTDLAAAVESADFVVEAIPENLELKRETFAAVDDAAPEEAILATNTSSLRVSDIAAATDRPDRCCGLHFFNPPIRMDLVEVVSGEQTGEGVVETALSLAESLDKTPIHVRKDVPQFVVNNVLTPFMGEAAWMLDDGAAEIRQADAAMVFSRGYPMGPFELNDFGGLDIFAHTREQWDDPVPESVASRVADGDLGRKTGQGFYSYGADGREGDASDDGQEGDASDDGQDDGDTDGVDYEPGDGEGFDALRIEARMINEAARLVGDDVADPGDVDLGMRLGGGLPEGTCRRGDKLGLDRVLEKLEALHAETGADRYEPAGYLVDLVEAGDTGEDAGRGFYDYSDGGPYHYVDHELTDEGVLQVTFDRAERLNAFSTDMFDEVGRVLDAADTDEVACVVFEGAGDRAFSAGADITGFMAAEPTELMAVDEAIQAIYEFERPTVAKVDGLCLGAGMEITLACDVRFAAEDAQLGSPEIDLGLIPGGGGTQRLVRLIGEPRTKELVFGGEPISASRAEEWGVLNRAVPAEDLDETVDSFVENVVSGPQTALKVAKQVIQRGQDASLETALALESQGFGLLTTTEDMREGVTAFTHDREPDFGRDGRE